jgi:hypothetical protein
MWSGTAQSWLDLHPPDSTESYGFGVGDGQQVGYAVIEGQPLAILWNGSAQGRVVLHPAGATSSEAHGVAGGWQAGWARFGGVQHAGVWHGAAASWEDLAPTLPGAWGSTFAQGIWSDGVTLHVFGYGLNSATGRNEALLWTRPVDPGCYPNCDHSSVPPLLNVLDFNCFLNAFAAGLGSANCDGSTTPPVLNVLDFNCFLNAFAAGCP